MAPPERALKGMTSGRFFYHQCIPETTDDFTAKDAHRSPLHCASRDRGGHGNTSWEDKLYHLLCIQWALYLLWNWELLNSNVTFLFKSGKEKVSPPEKENLIQANSLDVNYQDILSTPLRTGRKRQSCRGPLCALATCTAAPTQTSKWQTTQQELGAASSHPPASCPDARCHPSSTYLGVAQSQEQSENSRDSLGNFITA